MKAFAIVLFFLITNSLTAQTGTNWLNGRSGFETFWIGGTPGQETDWEVPQNWLDNRVPDEDSWVIIRNLNTGHGAMPEIDSEVKVAGIEVQQSAELTVSDEGMLLVDGEYANNHGILNFGKIINKGKIEIINTGLRPVYDLKNNIVNAGDFAVEEADGEMEYLVSDD